MATTMNKADATNLLHEVNTYIAGIQGAQLVREGRGYVVTGQAANGVISTFRWESDVRAHDSYDPDLPAKREAAYNLRWRKYDFEKDCAAILSDANNLAEQLRKIALRIETNATLAAARIKSADESDAENGPLDDAERVRFVEQEYSGLARRTLDELDSLDTRLVARDFGRTEVDLARSAIRYAALLGGETK